MLVPDPDEQRKQQANEPNPFINCINSPYERGTSSDTTSNVNANAKRRIAERFET